MYTIPNKQKKSWRSNKKTYLFILFFFISHLSFFSSASAQGLKYEMASYEGGATSRASTPFFNLSIFNKPEFIISYQNFSGGFQFFFDLLIGVSIALAVILFMVAAFKEIIDGDKPTDIKKGKEGMVNAIVGLMIVLSTWLIINTINPDLLRLPFLSALDKMSANSAPGGTSNSNVTSGPN
jgi:hypothetical protein